MAMNKLHPGARWSFRLRAYFSLVIICFILSTWFFGLIGIFRSNSLLLGIVVFILFYIISIFVIGEIYARMAYNRFLYEFTGDQLRIERGIIWKRYSNIPYERIQNVDVTRGIIARILGFSTVNIQTAGFSYTPNRMGGWSEGHLPAVSIDESEKIREFVMRKISRKGRSQGL